MLDSSTPDGQHELFILVSELFVDPDELRRMIALMPGGAKLGASLPGSTVSKDMLVHRVVAEVVAHGALAAFFHELATYRSGRRTDIDVLAGRFGLPPSPLAPPPSGGPRPRVRPDLLARFTANDGGRRRLESVLQKTALIANDAGITEKFAEIAELEQFASGEVLITQDATDTDILLILAGSVEVSIHGTPVSTRRAGQHVGEMALIDPTQRRCATVTAREDTVVARIGENQFSQIARTSPPLWRHLAVELAARLRERGGSIHPRPERPVLFVASPTAVIMDARTFAEQLRDDSWDVRVWADAGPGAGKNPLDSLLAQVKEIDFGVLMAANDALTGECGVAGEVHCLLGILLGRLGRDNTLLVQTGVSAPSPLDSRNLSDMSRLSVPDGIDDFRARSAAAASEARAIIRHRLSP